MGRSVGSASDCVGVAAAPAAQATVELLLERADEALYDAKASGRNRVQACAAGWPRSIPLRVPEGKLTAAGPATDKACVAGLAAT